MASAWDDPPRKMIECPVCEGWGQRFTSPHMTDPSAKDRWHDCSNCGGRGEIEAPEEEEEEENGNDNSDLEE